MKYTFDRVVRLVIALAVIIGLALLVNRLSGVLLPFLIGWLLAYLIHPLVKFVQYKMKVGNRGVSIAVALLFIAIVIVGLGVAVVPAISAEIMSISRCPLLQFLSRMVWPMLWRCLQAMSSPFLPIVCL